MTHGAHGQTDRRRALIVAVAGWIVLGFAGCAFSPTGEPPNLQPHKQQVRTYVESGDYQREIAAVAARARVWIEQRVAKGGAKLTVIFDLDETLLSNWPLLKKQDFGYVPAEWERWVEAGEAPAIEPVREIFLAARRAGMEVVFLTGRRERDRVGTEKNLRAIGCADYALLRCKADRDPRTSAAFKTAVRQELAAGGRTLIANIGDQESDLAGGFAERTFKLPNPFYLTE
jgi:predicted secreted acid phosphatase